MRRDFLIKWSLILSFAIHATILFVFIFSKVSFFESEKIILYPQAGDLLHVSLQTAMKETSSLAQKNALKKRKVFSQPSPLNHMKNGLEKKPNIHPNPLNFQLKQKPSDFSEMAQKSQNLKNVDILPKNKQENKMFESMLLSLEEQAHVAVEKKDKKDKKDNKQNEKNPSSDPSENEIDLLSRFDAIRYHFMKCWKMPVGAKDIQSLTVDIDLMMNSQGEIVDVIILNNERYNLGGFYQMAVDVARRSVMDPKCNNLSHILMDIDYEKWKTLHLTFDPSKMQ